VYSVGPTTLFTISLFAVVYVCVGELLTPRIFV
jgi:hypothetical protein